jgi:outer membrane biosynthesis protein TonB
MLKEISLRTAIAISFWMHVAAFSSWGMLHRGAPARTKDTRIEVYYVLEGARARAPESIDTVSKERRGTEALSRIERAAATRRPGERVVDRDDAVSVKESQQVEAENLEEYVAYYETIREKIRKSVTRNHRRLSEEGSVRVFFVLRKNGVLSDISIEDTSSTSSKLLRRVERDSVRYSSPFRPFPEALQGKGELTFSVDIIFTKE